MILRMAQAPPIYPVTQAVMTLNRLLMWDKISENSGIPQAVKFCFPNPTYVCSK